MANAQGKTSHVWEQLVALSNEGKSRDEICKILGKSSRQIYNIAQYARDKGHEVKLHKTTERVFIYNELSKKLVKNKPISKKGSTLLEGLPREVIRWVAGNIPDGGTVFDFVRSVLVDVYYEEVTSSTATPGSRSQGAPEGLTEH